MHSRSQADMLKAKGYISAADAAQRVGRHITGIYRLLDDGEVEELRIGRSRYINMASLIAYLNRVSPDAARLLGLTGKE